MKHFSNGARPVLEPLRWADAALIPPPSAAYARPKPAPMLPNRLRIFSGTANPVRF